MAIRIKRHWFQDGRERPPAAQASVIAVAIWKSATHGLQGLRKARYAVDVGEPFIRVLAEFVVFLVTVADRIAYLNVPLAGDADAAIEDSDSEASQGDWRRDFTVALAQRLSVIYQENLDQLVGPLSSTGAAAASDHAAAFIELLNRRMAEYADFDYADQGPEFAFLRYFGTCVEAALPNPADRKWVLDQVMAAQAPEAIEHLDRGMRGVLGLDPKPRRHSAAATAE